MGGFWEIVESHLSREVGEKPDRPQGIKEGEGDTGGGVGESKNGPCLVFGGNRKERVSEGGGGRLKGQSCGKDYCFVFFFGTEST